MKKPAILLILAFIAIAHESQAQNYSFNFDASGNRTDRIIVLAKSVTKSTASLSVNDSANIQKKEEISENVKIIIYPNPTREDVSINIQTAESTTSASLSVFDNSGRLIRTDSNLHENNSAGLSGFPAGNYILIININGKVSRWIIVKE